MLKLQFGKHSTYMLKRCVTPNIIHYFYSTQPGFW